MTKQFLFDFISKQKFAVVSTVTAGCQPESALVGIAVTPELKIIFDTASVSRKYANLVSNPSVAIVIGWENEQNVQYEGRARFPGPGEPDSLLPVYFEAFPDGRKRKETWKDIAYVVVEPSWIRYSDFAISKIEELLF